MYINLNRIEFKVTYKCSSRCKHCAASDILNTGSYSSVDTSKAVQTINKLSKLYNIESVMTFGGEPLLYSDVVCSIHHEAKNSGIEYRSLITNGFFTKDKEIIDGVTKRLAEDNVNILLSVDAFHQEIVPIDIVHMFAESAVNSGIKSIRLHPAWVVDEANDNSYNNKTKEILGKFIDLNMEVSGGNNIFLSGNAAKYLSEYYDKQDVDLTMSCGKIPYSQTLDNITSISIVPNGDVMVCCFIIGNIYDEDIETIVKRYNPYENNIMKVILSSGITGLLEYANLKGVTIDTSKYYSTCDVCRSIFSKLNQLEV